MEYGHMAPFRWAHRQHLGWNLRLGFSIRCRAREAHAAGQ